MLVVKAFAPPVVVVAATDEVGGATPAAVELDADVLEVAASVPVESWADANRDRHVSRAAETKF